MAGAGKRISIAFGLFFGLAPLIASAQSGGASDEGMLVIYGPSAPTREGDVDRREQVFFSVPADLEGRLYVRIYDPEVFGSGDFTYGGPTDSETAFRVFGGDGAFSEADRPDPVADGARPSADVRREPVTGPGRVVLEKSYGSDRASNERWVTLGAVRPDQGEIINGRAYFRIDVQAMQGNDGNAYSLGVSLARERDRAPDGLEMFAFQPTVRWSANLPPTRVGFDGSENGPYTVQSFDAANAEIALITDFQDIPVRVSGQDFWTSDTANASGQTLALSLSGGFETPNDVTMSVYDRDGQAIALKMPPVRAPVPARPTANGTARPLADCRAVAFDASGSGGRVPLSFEWDFGDGQTSDDPVIAHRYDQPGRYVARLSVMEPGLRAGRGDRIEVPVHVRNAPIAVPGANITVAPGQAVAFDGRGSEPSDSPITQYSWTFGDGARVDGTTAEHVYATPGLYRAVLRVGDDSQHPCNFGLATREVTVNTPPVAEAGTDLSAIVGQAIRLDGSSSYDVDGAIAAYRWDMGDGTLLEGVSQSYSYAQPGTYRVTLTAIDDSGVANNTASDGFIVVVNAPPVPVIETPPRRVSVSELAVLDGSNSSDDDGQILSYYWDFGDGAVGEGQVVSYAWTKPGTYQVVLTVEDDSGTASAVQSTAMNVVVDASPVSNAGPDQFVTASEVTFDGGLSTDSDGRIVLFEWDFGDGSQGKGQKVTHAYARPGTFEVALVVRDDSGAPLNVDRDTMMVTINTLPIADAGPPKTVAPGEAFVVSGRASVDPDGQVSAYLWTFPDGTTARGERVAHSIDDPGLHRLRLTVSDDFPGGPASDEAEVLITVNDQPVAIAGSDVLIAPGETVRFDATQSYDPDGQLVSYRWEFDDLGDPLDAPVVDRAYPTPGIWTVQLVVTDDSGVENGTATDDKTVRVNHTPVAEAGADINTDQLIVAFDGSGSVDADGDMLIYRWDFGDGSAPAFGQKISHVFPRSGIYPVTLRVDDGTGLANATDIDATSVEINARPMADAGGNRDVCSGAPILFDASASIDPDGGLLLYEWDFGDGTVSDLVNPTKTYEAPGTYPVTLKIRNETGTERGTDVDRIAVLVREGPIADAGPDKTVRTNQQIRFDGSGSTDADGAVNAFQWTFGDGGTGSGENPVHIFDKPGTYSVTLTITGEARGDCSPLDTDVAEVTVTPAPIHDIETADRQAAGVEGRFAVTLSDTNGDTPTAHRWSFSDGAEKTGSEISHAFATPGVYFVDLATDFSGGETGDYTLTARRKIVVNDAPVPLIDGPVEMAAGQAVVFDASMSSDSDGAITSFDWDFGDGQTASGVFAGHVYRDPGRFVLTLAVTDDASVGNSTRSLTREILVNPAPVAALKAPPAICPAETVPWTVAATGGTKVDWVFGDGARANGPEVRHSFDRPGLFPVNVVLDDGSGLANAISREEVYVRVNSAPTAMAGPDRMACAGDTVVFDASRSGDLDGDLVDWTWTFSDGVVLSGARVERMFDAPADLSVQLTVTDDSQSSCATGMDTARILVNAPPVVDAGPDMTIPVGAAHDTVRFDATAARDPDGHGLRISWDFGDGTSATGAVARHKFSGAGAYTVTVTAQDTTGLACGIARDTATITAVPRSDP